MLYCLGSSVMQNSINSEFKEQKKLSPIYLTPQQEDLIKRLDMFNQKTIQGQNMAKMFEGALYAVRGECRSNPDWMAQSAHSFREILYPFFRKDRKRKRIKKVKNIDIVDAFKYYGSATTEEETIQHSIKVVYGQMTDIAHHQLMSVEKYEKLIEEFQRVLSWALARQVDVHNQIDSFFLENKPTIGG
jgi:signal-transduction protein with cAMP-binding, CBS, and nucleotidyltransferase domain